jgi:uncharacterized protein YkwD
MRSFIGLSITTVTLLVMLVIFFLFWNSPSHKDISATVINATILPDNDESDPVPSPESTTTTAGVPIEITATPPDSSFNIPQLPVKIADTKTQATTLSPRTQPDLTAILHTLTNTTRLEYNRTNVTLDARLSMLAKERSEDMIDQNYFSHISPDGCDLQCRFTKSNYKTLTWGENLAESTSYKMLNSQELAGMFMESWLKSSSHRDNLLSTQFTHHGIGVATKAGRIVVTVIFAAQ